MNTPTPWRHEMREITEFGGAYPCIMSGDIIVAIVLDQEVPDSAAAEQANANLIVDAVNVHNAPANGSVAYNLRAEADMIDQYLNDCAPVTDPSAFRLSDDDVKRVAKTMREAADLLIGKDALRKAREALAFAMIHNGCNNKLFREALDGIGGDSTELPSPIES